MITQTQDEHPPTMGVYVDHPFAEPPLDHTGEAKAPPGKWYIGFCMKNRVCVAGNTTNDTINSVVEAVYSLDPSTRKGVVRVFLATTDLTRPPISPGGKLIVPHKFVSDVSYKLYVIFDPDMTTMEC